MSKAHFCSFFYQYILDQSWLVYEFLFPEQALEQLRQVIGLRSYGQRDPLVEYKKEAFHLFENLLNKLKIDFVTILINLQIVQEPTQEEEALKPTKIDLKQIKKKMSRNEPCSCGSGKKYKKCCGAL